MFEVQKMQKKKTAVVSSQNARRTLLGAINPFFTFRSGKRMKNVCLPIGWALSQTVEVALGVDKNKRDTFHCEDENREKRKENHRLGLAGGNWIELEEALEYELILTLPG